MLNQLLLLMNKTDFVNDPFITIIMTVSRYMGCKSSVQALANYQSYPVYTGWGSGAFHLRSCFWLQTDFVIILHTQTDITECREQNFRNNIADFSIVNMIIVKWEESFLHSNENNTFKATLNLH
ncbi:hypothetical protein ACTFIW_005466 [Dictyostelium discoideum]